MSIVGLRWNPMTCDAAASAVSESRSAVALAQELVCLAQASTGTKHRASAEPIHATIAHISYQP